MKLADNLTDELEDEFPLIVFRKFVAPTSYILLAVVLINSSLNFKRQFCHKSIVL